MDRFTVDYVDDEHIVVTDTVTNDTIASANHDEDGWAGMDKLESLVARINEALR